MHICTFILYKVNINKTPIMRNILARSIDFYIYIYKNIYRAPSFLL